MHVAMGNFEARVAQSEARTPHKGEAAGSNPAPGTPSLRAAHAERSPQNATSNLATDRGSRQPNSRPPNSLPPVRFDASGPTQGGWNTIWGLMTGNTLFRAPAQRRPVRAADARAERPSGGAWVWLAGSW